MTPTENVRLDGDEFVLVVDDDAVTRGLLSQMVRKCGYEVVLANHGGEAIEILKKRQIHFVLTDWLMPEVNGPDLCRWIRSQELGRHVFILMLTSLDQEENVVEALDAGADEFIRKPIRAAELHARLRSAQRMMGLASRDVTIFTLAELADSRDPETGDHLNRMRHFSKVLAEEIVRTRTCGDVPAGLPELLFATSPMHDIGKVGIPDAILLKPGHLSGPEFEIMKTHTTIGANALNRALRRFPDLTYLRTARDIALTHHERFDGTGYPAGLKGEDIPLVGRIVGLCDAYDAMTAKRVYKAARPHYVARAEILRSSGTHFDPRLVEAFLAVERSFAEIMTHRGSKSELALSPAA